MIKTKCILCGLDLKDNDGFDDSDFGKVLIEPQVKIWVHDPRSIHYDIQVTVHKVCYDKVKTIYPDFDKPTQADWSNPKYPVIDKDVVSLKTITQLDNLKRI
jgi:hypothetical protein